MISDFGSKNQNIGAKYQIFGAKKSKCGAKIQISQTKFH